jgi:hypothetical protein
VWDLRLGIEKIPIFGDDSLNNIDFVPNCMAFKLTNFDWFMLNL